MRWYHYLYLPEATAAQIGFTHSGRIFGVPAWINDDDPDGIIACPKFVLLQFYAMAMDALFEFVALTFDATLTTPYVALRSIQPGAAFDA